MKVLLATFALLSTLAAFSEAIVPCYWGAWANKRPGIGRYGVSDIPTDLCTHIIYSFVGLNPKGEITQLNDQNEIEGKTNTYEDFIALKEKNKDLKLILAVGGWSEGSTNFTIVANNATLRQTFASNVVEYLTTYKFDGLDVDWEYPAQRGGNNVTDKEAFVELLKELKEQFADKNFALSIAVGVTQTHVDQSYSVAEINKIVDYIHLMTYDLHGTWDGVTGANAPLYPQLTDEAGDVLNVNTSVHVWLNEGADPAKLVLGLAAYGKTFTLTNVEDNGTGAPINGSGTAGPYTQEAGTYAYYEICLSQKENATAWNITEVEGNYVYGNLDTFWVGYDNPNTIAAKAKYAKDLNLGGVFFWALDLDDFSGQCDGTTYPLIKSAKKNFEH